MKRNFLSILFIAMSLFFFGNSGCFAQTIWNGTSDTTWYSASADTFYLSSGEELAGFAQLVNSGSAFNGKTIMLTSDIWLNANDSINNNWLPIGGDPTASSEAGSSPKTFEGIFDGNYHTIYNLYVNKENYFQAGFFGLIKSATVKNLAFINPYVKSKGMMGVITGWFYSGGASYITDCMVINATIIGTGGNNIGAIFGAGYSNYSGNYVTNCAATGNISGNYPGGLAGNAQYSTFTNCYFAGTLSGTPQGGITAYSGTLNNCYSNISASSGANSGTVLTSDSLKSADFIYLIGHSIFQQDCDNINVNNGYPILSWWLCGVPVSGRTSICIGESTVLTASGYNSYLWSTGATTATITVSPTTTTDYYITATASSGITVTDTVTVTINPQAIVTARVYIPFGEQVHGTVTPAQTTVPCGGTDLVTLTITPDAGWHITRIFVNDSLYRGVDPSDGEVVTFTFSPDGTLADVVIYFGNTYIITSYAVLPDGTYLNRSDLVVPWGENGVTTFLAGTDTTFTFNETERYHLSDVEINGISQGDISSYTFNNISNDNNVVHAHYYEDCAITSIPYTQDFSSYSTYPECWGMIITDPTRTVSINSTTYHNTPKSLSIQVQSYYTEAIMPAIDSSFAMNSLQIAFSARANLASQTGFLIIGIMTDPDYDSTFVPVDTVSVTSTWTDFIIYLSNYTGDGHYISFKCIPSENNFVWVYIDDITIDYAPVCSDITGLTVSNITGNSAILSWNPTLVGTVNNYYVDYSSDNGVTWTQESTNATQHVLNGIDQATTYLVRVITMCLEGESQPVYVNFTTPCLTLESVQIGNGTNNTSGDRLLFNNLVGYSYTQQIYSAEEFDYITQEITGIAFQYTSSAMTRNLTVYLGHVPQSSFTASASFIDDSLFTEVYSGDVAFNNTGVDNWFTISFQQNFQYNGLDNLVLVVDDNTGAASYASFAPNFYTHSTSEITALYYGNYSTNADPSNPPAPGSYFAIRNNIKFIYCGTTVCPSPNVIVNNITDHTVDFSWLSNGNEYEIAYKLHSDSNWIYLDTTSLLSFSFSGLQMNTTYDLSVKTICQQYFFSNPTIITFTTSCGSITSIPFVENFDNHTSASPMPDCWRKIYANDYYPSVSTSQYQSAPKSLCIYSTPVAPCYAILPEIDSSIDIRTLKANFNLYISSGIMELGIMNDPTDGNTFTVIDTISWNTTGSWLNSEVYFNHYTGNGRYIAFRHSANFQYYMAFIDDVIIDLLPSCLIPGNLTADNITSETVELSWFENGTATQWEIEYGQQGYTSGTGTMISANSNPFILTGLTGNTDYEFYVRAVCDSNDRSEWSSILLFTTDCYSTEIPYFESFDSTAAGNIPDCWSVISNSGSQGNVAIGSYNYSAPNSMGITLNDTSSLHYVYAVSNLLNIDSVDSLTVSFKAMKNNFSDRKLVVGVLDTYDDINTLIVIDTLSSIGTSWNDYMISLQSYNGTGKYITIGVPAGDNGSASFWIDNLVIDYILSCYSPVNLTVSAITTTTADLSWLPGGDENQWILEYKASNESNWTSVPCNSAQSSLTGLSPATLYQAKVKALCGTGDESAYSSVVTFTTLPLTYTVSVTYGTGGSVSPSGDVSVNAGENKTFTMIPDEGYEVLEVTVDGSSVLDSVVNNQYTFWNISTNHLLNVFFQNIGISEFSNSGFVRIFPNPASDQFEIVFDNSNMNIKSIRLYDIYGKVVKGIPVEDTHITVDVKELSSGLYLLHILPEEGLGAMYKIVKK